LLHVVIGFQKLRAGNLHQTVFKHLFFWAAAWWMVLKELQIIFTNSSQRDAFGI
jgi:hypothetical protein